MAGKGAKLEAILTIVGKVDPSVARAAKDAQKQVNGLASSGSSATVGIGSKLAAGFAAAAAAAAGAAVAMGVAGIKAGIDFESAFAGVTKTVDGTETQLANIRQGLRDMTQEVPKTHEDLAGIAEMAGQLGIKADDILRFTRTMADLDVATNLGGEEGAQQLAQFMNIYKTAPELIENMGSAIVDLGNNSATTEQDIMNMASRLAAGMSNANISEADTLGFSAGLASIGLEAEAAGTAFTKFQRDLGMAADLGGKSLEGFAKVSRMSTKEFADLYKKDATAATLAFLKGMKQSNDEGYSLNQTLADLDITEARYADTLRRSALAYDLVSESVERSRDAWEDNTALAKEAAERYKTVESRLTMLKSKTRDMGISFYDAVAPLLGDGLDGVSSILDRISDAAGRVYEKFVESGLSEKLGEIFGGWGESLDDSFTKTLGMASDLLENIINFLADNPQALDGMLGKFTQLIEMLNDVVTVARPFADLLEKGFFKGWGKLSDILPKSGFGGLGGGGGMGGLAATMASSATSNMFGFDVKDIFGLSSKEMMAVGSINPMLLPIASSFGLIADEIRGVEKSGSSMSDTIKNNFSNACTNMAYNAHVAKNRIGEAIAGARLRAKVILQSLSPEAQALFSGIVQFLNGVITNDWASAWEGAKLIFANIAGGIQGIFEGVINFIISQINGLIGMVNGLKLPGWLGGGSLNIPTVNYVGDKGTGFAYEGNRPDWAAGMSHYASGGITSGPSIAGEGGYPEYVIPTDPAYRSRAQSLLDQANQTIGGGSAGSSSGTATLNYSPVINVQGGGDRATIAQILEQERRKIEEMLRQIMRDEERSNYGRIPNASI